MVSDNRIKHDPLTRSLALKLFEQGFGYKFVSSHFGIPRNTVQQWYYKYRAIDPGGVLMMGGKQKKYSYDLKLEAAKAVVERGMSYSESLRELPNRSKVAIVSALSGQFPLAILLECVALARSSYY
ncbi:MAG: helix-turn-helix domain-containing protein [Peptococcus niger]